MMALPDFTIDYHTAVPVFSEEIQDEIETRLLALAEGNTDLTGAAVAVTQPAEANTAFIYHTRIVVYMRPNDIAANKESDTLEGSVKAALDAIERQVREERKRLRDAQRNGGANQ